MNGSLIPYPRSVYWCCPVCVRHAGRYGRRTGWAAGRSLVLGGSQATKGECSRVFWMPTVHTDLEVGQSQRDSHVCGFAWLWDRTSETPLREPGECGPGLRGPNQRICRDEEEWARELHLAPRAPDDVSWARQWPVARYDRQSLEGIQRGRDLLGCKRKPAFSLPIQ